MDGGTAHPDRDFLGSGATSGVDDPRSAALTAVPSSTATPTSGVVDYVMPANLTRQGRQAFVQAVQTYARDLAIEAENEGYRVAGNAPEPDPELELTGAVVERAAVILATAKPARPVTPALPPGDGPRTGASIKTTRRLFTRRSRDGALISDIGSPASEDSRAHSD